LSLGLAAPAAAQDAYNVHFRSSTVTGPAGSTVTLGIGIANQPSALTGFSFGVKHDATKLTLESVDIGPDLQAALGPGKNPDEQFFAVNKTPQGGTGFTVAIILSKDDKNIVLAPGPDHHVFNAKYKIADAATGDAKVDVTGDLGTPKVAVILDKNGTAQAPVGAGAITSAVITVQAGPPPFKRGDASQSGRYEVSDGIIILDYLFSGGTLPAGASTRANCAIAMNFDGTVTKGTPGVEDEADIDITDAITFLQFLFQSGPVPAAPYPACGQPAIRPSPDFECKEFQCH
jgi:hypothetical protein